MKRQAMRRAAAVAALCAVALCGGCSDNSGPEDASGTWEGSLSLRLADGTTMDGPLTLVLTQNNSFISGSMEWEPIGETQSLAGPLDGIDVTLRALFRCEKGFETTVLEGTIDGDSIDIDEASGLACTAGGTPSAVSDGSASLAHATDGVPF
jgi:hypothetical protein